MSNYRNCLKDNIKKRIPKMEYTRHAIKNVLFFGLVSKISKTLLIVVDFQNLKKKIAEEAEILLKFFYSVYSIPRARKIKNEDHYYIHDR